MEIVTLYEVMYEGKNEHTCANCIHEDICEAYSDVAPMDDSGECEIWEEEEDSYENT